MRYYSECKKVVHVAAYTSGAHAGSAFAESRIYLPIEFIVKRYFFDASLLILSIGTMLYTFLSHQPTTRILVSQLKAYLTKI